ncbi:hypothetical protein V498_00339 [Pseudogymnoascus sp. VKM F-4517 (FW-2822)]|nr:hypothetical protein V498_00339 [Pseudogymnoascus sp. VKM F-4517 (FW-2822)]
MNYEAGNGDSDQELQDLGHSKVGDQCNNLVGNSLSKNVDSDIGSPFGKSHGCDAGTSGVINPDADENVHDQLVFIDTEGWQKRKWEDGGFQFAQDSTESVVSFNSEIESDVGSWTIDDGSDANLKLHELQIRDMASANEASKARTRKVQKELSDNEKAFKKQLDDVNLKHAETVQAQKEVLDTERAAALKARQGFIHDYDYLTAKYNTACAQVEYQTQKRNALEAKLSEYTKVLNQVKAPDGSIYTHKQRQDVIEGLKRDTKYNTACAQVEYQTQKRNALEAKLSEYTKVLNQVKAPEGSIYTHKQRQDVIEGLKRDTAELKEFYKNQVKTLEHQVVKKSARLDERAEESRNLQFKIQALDTELLNEKQNFKKVAAMLELERKSHMDTEEISLRDFQARVRDVLGTVEYRDRQIQQMDNIIRSLQAHLIAAQQSYAASVGSMENFRRAHEKSSEENCELVKQHRHDMEVMAVSHQAACDVYSSNEAVLRDELATLTKRLGLMGDNCSCGKWKSIATAMKQEITDLRADPRTSSDTLTSNTLTCGKKDLDAQLPSKTPKEEVKTRKSGSEILGEAVASVDKKRLDKGKGIADDIAEKRSREAAKKPSELPDSELSKLQDTFRKGMAKAQINQGKKKKATPQAMHSGHPTQPFWPKTTPVSRLLGKPTQPSEPKPTPMVGNSYKPIQPPNPGLASAPTHPDQPTQPSNPKSASAPARSDEHTQPSKPKPASAPSHPEQPTQPSKEKPALVTAHSEKSTQPLNPRPASAPIDTARQPPKPATISKIPVPAKVQPEDQSKETPVAAQPASSRKFSGYRESTYWIKPYGGPVNKTDEVQAKSTDGERCCPIPIPIAEKQKSAEPGNEA